MRFMIFQRSFFFAILDLRDWIRKWSWGMLIQFRPRQKCPENELSRHLRTQTLLEWNETYKHISGPWRLFSVLLAQLPTQNSSLERKGLFLMGHKVCQKVSAQKIPIIVFDCNGAKFCAVIIYFMPTQEAGSDSNPFWALSSFVIDVMFCYSIEMMPTAPECVLATSIWNHKKRRTNWVQVRKLIGF